MAGALAPQLRACDAPKVLVDDRNKVVKGVSSALTDGEKQLRDSGRVRHAIGHPRGLRIGHGWGAPQEKPHVTDGRTEAESDAI